LITLPPAGILGLSALLALRRGTAEASPAAAGGPAGTGPAGTGPAGTRAAGTAAPPVNGAAPQADETPDQAGGEPGPAGA
ncbi:MAG: hypothetical protein QOG05_1764, partial [Streptosporangiaceae bacterium]|nr:hypothetical protein [Streptosporangiaceae bacterium]